MPRTPRWYNRTIRTDCVVCFISTDIQFIQHTCRQVPSAPSFVVLFKHERTLFTRVTAHLHEHNCIQSCDHGGGGGGGREVVIEPTTDREPQSLAASILYRQADCYSSCSRVRSGPWRAALFSPPGGLLKTLLSDLTNRNKYSVIALWFWGPESIIMPPQQKIIAVDLKKQAPLW